MSAAAGTTAFCGAGPAWSRESHTPAPARTRINATIGTASLPSEAARQPRPRARRPRLGAHAVDTHRLRDVLHLLLAEKIEAERKLALDRVVDRRGDADPAALGERLHARGDVDAVAIDRAVGFLDHVAEVDPYAELHAPFRRELDVVAFEHFLDLDRGLDRLDRTRELGQQRIARRVDHAAAAAHHQAGDDVAIGLEGLDGGGLVGRHQTRIADHVCAQDRGQLASAAWVGHRPPLTREQAESLCSPATASNLRCLLVVR